MSIFRFCRIIEDCGRQYLLRAANHTYFIGMGSVPGPATALTIDTWGEHPDGYDWMNLRMALHLPGHVALLQSLECFTSVQARQVGWLLDATHAQQLTQQEQLEEQQRLNESVYLAVLRRYGSMG